MGFDQHHSVSQDPTLRWALAFGVVVAVAVPTLLAFHRAPSTTFYNQLAALLAWGCVLLALVPARGRGAGERSALGALGVLALAVYLTVLRIHSISEFSTLLLLMAVAALVTGATRADDNHRRQLISGLSVGWLLAGLAGMLIGLIQVFAPEWAQEPWIARSGMPGRAVGNLRQPNHLATVLLCASVGLVTIAGLRSWSLRWVLALMTALVGGVVLTASRSGLWAGLSLLFLWGLIDRQLPRRLRLVLLLTPVMASVVWFGMHAWAASGQGMFAAEARLDSEGAGSPSRTKILTNAFALLSQQPWAGVGWGSFNRAWTLTEFPDRPIAFFDHTHNLVVQFLVELGWPLGLLVLALLLFSASQLVRLALRARGTEAIERHGMLLLLLVVALHSMLEYPLWYAYFLLPTALAWGLLATQPSAAVLPSTGRWRTAAAGTALLLACAVAQWEYGRVSAIYAPGRYDEPLESRVRNGQRSLFLSRHADYAAATAFGANAAALAAAQRTGHQLIDARLLIAWAKSLHAVGETDKARYLVARLREFRSREGTDWLKVCAEDPSQWMCAAPQKAYSWRDF